MLATILLLLLLLVLYLEGTDVAARPLRPQYAALVVCDVGTAAVGSCGDSVDSQAVRQEPYSLCGAAVVFSEKPFGVKSGVGRVL